MKASFSTVEDGTVYINITAEDWHEQQLLTVFFSQTYRAGTCARVLRLGSRDAQFASETRVLPKEPV